MITTFRFHEFLKLENEIGNITRQEAVSMVGWLNCWGFCNNIIIYKNFCVECLQFFLQLKDCFCCRYLPSSWMCNQIILYLIVSNLCASKACFSISLSLSLKNKACFPILVYANDVLSLSVFIYYYLKASQEVLIYTLTSRPRSSSSCKELPR